MVTPRDTTFETEHRALIKEARELIAAENYHEAGILLNRVLRIEPSHEEARELMDLCQVKIQHSDTLDSIIRSARLAYERGELDRAISSWKQVLTVIPDHDQVRCLLKEAERKLEQRETVTALLLRIQNALEDQNVELIRALLKELEDLDPHHPRLREFQERSEVVGMRLDHLKRLVDEAQKFQKMGELSKALDHWEMVLNLVPDHDLALQAISVIQHNLDEHERESWIAKWLRFADQNLDQHDYEQAIYYAERVLAIQRNQPEAAKILQRAEDALIRLQDIKKLMEMAEFLCEREEYERAILMWTTVISLKGDDSQVKVKIEYAQNLIARRTPSALQPPDSQT